MPVGKRALLNTPVAIYEREYMRQRRASGLCRCGKFLALTSKSRCQGCLDSDRRIQAEMRDKVLTAYGRKCACCGESEVRFLAVDHIEGKGNQHRLSVGGNKKSPILRWLIKHNFPPEFQLLCHNCNMATYIYGICPHKAEKPGV